MLPSKQAGSGPITVLAPLGLTCSPLASLPSPLSLLPHPQALLRLACSLHMLQQLHRQDDQAHHCEGLAGLLWGPGLSPCTRLKVGILIFPAQPWSPASFAAHHGPSPLHSTRGPVCLSEYIQLIPLPWNSWIVFLDPFSEPGISWYCSSSPLAQLQSFSIAAC